MRRDRRAGQRGIAPREAERAVDREILHHIEELADRLQASGMERAEAVAEARRRFGNVDRLRAEMVRETRGVNRRMRIRDRLGGSVFDVRYALRALSRNSTFALTVVGTVALGIGAAAAVFTFLDNLLLRPLPYEAPEQLYTVGHAQDEETWLPFLWAEQVDTWKDAARLEMSAEYEGTSMVRTGNGQPETVYALAVTPELSDLLGVRPFLGRGFVTEDTRPGANRAMLTWQYWKDNGGNRDVVGTTLQLNGEAFEVVGVLPRDFKFPVGSLTRIWIALPADRRVSGVPLDRVTVLTRIPDGTTVETLRDRLASVALALAEAAPHRRGWSVHLEPVGGWRGNPDLVRGVWMMAAAVGLMLLVALVNGINLLLFRAADRSHELAVRMALGGGRVRLVNHLLAEGLIIGIAAGVGAVVLALISVAGINRLLPFDFAFSSAYSFRVETRVLAFTFTLSLVTGLVLGWIPAIRVLRGRLHFDVLKGRGGTRSRNRFNQILVGAEVALVVTLLAGAGLLARSVLQLLGKDPGFEADNMVMMSIHLPDSRYTTAERRAAFFGRLEQELESIAEVEAVTISDGLPPHSGFSFGLELQAEGGESLSPEDSREVQGLTGWQPEYVLVPQISVSPDFLSVLGGRLLSGRAFEPGDVGLDNVLVNDQLARALWDGVIAGRRFRTGPERPWLTVVGVFQHMPFLGLDDRSAPYAIAFPRDPTRTAAYMSAGIRTTVPPSASLAAIRAVVERMDRDLPIAELATARAALVETIEKPRFLMGVMLGIAATSLILTAIGIYGVLSYAVAQRRREMGIRLALGSMPHRVRSMIVTSGLTVAAIGSLVGLVMALMLSRLVVSLLFGVQPNDPLTMAAVIVIVLLVALVASWVPAQRATRVNPVQVLRAD